MNDAYFFGGVEHDEKQAIFKTEFSLLFAGSGAGKWKTEYLYSENSGKTESFTRGNFQKTLDKIKEKLKDRISGKETGGKDDQLLLYISAHGNEPKKDDKTHTVEAADGSVSMDDLQSIVTLAEQAKVKLAIVSQSCNSGNILKLETNNTCIISGSGEKSGAYSGGAEYFAFEIQDAFRKGTRNVSLEQVFLTARKKQVETAIPMINTDAGKKAAEFLKSVELFLTTTNEFHLRNVSACSQDKAISKNFLGVLDVLLREQVNDPKLRKRLMNQFQEIEVQKHKMKSIYRALAKLENNPPLLCQRKITVKNSAPKFQHYSPKYDAEGNIVTSFSDDQPDVEVIYHLRKNKSQKKRNEKCEPFVGTYWAYLNIDQVIENTTDPDMRMVLYHWKDVIDTIEDKKGFKKILNNSIRTKSQLDAAMLSKAKALVAKEKEVFQELYSYFRSQESSNACSEFVL